MSGCTAWLTSTDSHTNEHALVCCIIGGWRGMAVRALMFRGDREYSKRGSSNRFKMLVMLTKGVCFWRWFFTVLLATGTNCYALLSLNVTRKGLATWRPEVNQKNVLFNFYFAGGLRWKKFLPQFTRFSYRSPRCQMMLGRVGWEQRQPIHINKVIRKMSDNITGLPTSTFWYLTERMNELKDVFWTSVPHLFVSIHWSSKIHWRRLELLTDKSQGADTLIMD